MPMEQRDRSAQSAAMREFWRRLRQHPHRYRTFCERIGGGQKQRERTGRRMRKWWAELRQHPRKYLEHCYNIRPFVDYKDKRYGNLVVVKYLGVIDKYRVWECRRDCGHALALRCNQFESYGQQGCLQCSWFLQPVTYQDKTKLLREWSRELGISYNTLSHRVRSLGMKPADALALGADRGYKIVTVNGVSHSFSKWARILGCSRQVINERIKHGWTPEQAVSVPLGEGVRVRGRPKTMLTFRRKTQTLDEWAKQTGVHKSTIRARMKCGWPVERILKP
jgi:hypothetical protein